MLKIIQRFGRHCSCHLQGEYVMVGRFGIPRVHLQLDISPLFRSTNQHHQIQRATYFLPSLWLLKTPNHYVFTLKMAVAMFAETLDNFQHSTLLIPES
jgi:hypothetical protein